MKQETTFLYTDYCFFSLKGGRVLGKQSSCGSSLQGAVARCCGCVGEWNDEMIFDVCGFN